MKYCRKLAKDKQYGNGQEQKDINMVKFDELVVISNCLNVMGLIKVQVAWWISEHHSMSHLIGDPLLHTKEEFFVW